MHGDELPDHRTKSKAGPSADDTASFMTAEVIHLGDPADGLAAGDSSAFGQIPEFEAALKRHSASFAQLSVAVFYSRPKHTTDAYQRGTYLKYIQPLTEAFETAHGGLTYSFYCENIIAAAALTESQELFLISPGVESDLLPIFELLSDCDRLNVEVSRVLSGPERITDLKTSKTLLYQTVVKLLALAERGSQKALLEDSVLELHRRELKNAQEYYLRAASRFAQFDYFRGMVISGSVLSVLVVLVSAPLRFFVELGPEITTLLGSLVAGSIGAVISVMSRMTFGGLSLDYEAGKKLLTMLGAFRPFLGMGFGAAMWVLTGSGILGSLPTEPVQLQFFRILMAFLAGFSERFAQDMLGRATDRINTHHLGRAKQD